MDSVAKSIYIISKLHEHIECFMAFGNQVLLRSGQVKCYLKKPSKPAFIKMFSVVRILDDQVATPTKKEGGRKKKPKSQKGGVDGEAGPSTKRIRLEEVLPDNRVTAKQSSLNLLMTPLPPRPLISSTTT